MLMFQPKERRLVFPVTSFTTGDRLRIVVEPSFHTNRKFYVSNAIFVVMFRVSVGIK